METNLASALPRPLALHGRFHVLDDFIGYGQLLVRCAENVGHQIVYTDLRFEGVTYAELPAHFSDPVVRPGTAAEVRHVASRLRLPVWPPSQRVFVLESGLERHPVLAARLEVAHHALLPLGPTSNQPLTTFSPSLT